MSLTKLKSALSTVRETLQAVRELPGATHEAIAFARENSEIKRELGAANAQIDKGLNLHQGWLDRCIELQAELETVRDECQRKLDLQLDAVKAIEKERDAANGEWDSIARERNELRAKLARYEATETWHQVTGGEGELPPEGVRILFRISEFGALLYGQPDRESTFWWRYLSSKDVTNV